MDNIDIERIRKIRELAINGIAGEQTSAQKLFDQLVEKYHLEDYDFESSSKRDYEFMFNDKFEEKLLIQIFSKVTESDEIYEISYTATSGEAKSKLKGYCSESQKIQIEFLFDFYNTLWQEELEVVLAAFIQKHALFRHLKKDETKASEYDQETIDRIFSLMEGLVDKEPISRITST